MRQGIAKPPRYVNQWKLKRRYMKILYVEPVNKELLCKRSFLTLKSNFWFWPSNLKWQRTVLAQEQRKVAARISHKSSESFLALAVCFTIYWKKLRFWLLGRDNLTICCPLEEIMPSAQNPSVCFLLDLFLWCQIHLGELIPFSPGAEAQLCRVQSSPARLRAMASLHFDDINSTVNTCMMYKYIVNICINI